MIENENINDENLTDGFNKLRNNKHQLLRFSSDAFVNEECKKIANKILNTEIFKIFSNKISINDTKVFINKKYTKILKVFFICIFRKF